MATRRISVTGFGGGTAGRGATSPAESGSMEYSPVSSLKVKRWGPAAAVATLIVWAISLAVPRAGIVETESGADNLLGLTTNEYGPNVRGNPFCIA